jgi:hypothetical protein
MWQLTIRPGAGVHLTLTMKERKPSIRWLRGWAIAVLNEALANREWSDHGWMQDRAIRMPRACQYHRSSVSVPGRLFRGGSG